MSFPPTATQVQESLYSVYRQILEHGLVHHNQPEWRAMPRSQYPLFASAFTLRPYARRLCKEMGRPFVWIETYKWNDYTTGEPMIRSTLMLKRTKRMGILGTPLLVQAEETASRWHGAKSQAVLWYSKEVTNFRFFFNGQEGKKRLHDWIRMTQTNPAMRAALKLPPL